MGRFSDRAQFEPVVALVAVLAVSAGLVTYADTLGRLLPDEQAGETAGIALDSVHERLRVGGVALPGRLDRAVTAAPDGWEMNVTLRTREGQWQRGPDPGPHRDGLEATRMVSVRVAPATVEPGTLRVVLWR